MASTTATTGITSPDDAIKVLKSMGYRPRRKNGNVHVFLGRYDNDEDVIRRAGIPLAFMGWPSANRAEYRVEGVGN